MEKVVTTNGNFKRAWTKPDLEVLEVSKTAFWEFKWDSATGFYKNVSVDELLACYS